MPTNQAPELSFAEIDRMRDILAQQDARRTPNVFDLSKPPVVPYSHQEFPKTVYHHKQSKPGRIITREVAIDGRPVDSTHHVAPKIVSKTVKNADELQKALADGWDEKPPTFKEAVPEQGKPLSAVK